MTPAINMQLAPTTSMWSGSAVVPPVPTGALEGSDGTVFAGSDDVEITGSNG